MVNTHHFGLELTDNSKTGWAFSLSRSQSCVQATSICKRLCYGNGIRYQSAAQKAKRERNFKTVEYLLDMGGSELLAQNLVALVDQARPADWLAAKISGVPTSLPWSVRIHDVGDWHTTRYVQAWQIAVAQRPSCKFWFYTRSFADADLLGAIAQLASLPNCSGLLSIDSENFDSGLLAFARHSGVFKLALLQEKQADLDPELLPAVARQVKQGQIINFPYHHGGRHVKPLLDSPLTNCPQITSEALPLVTNKYMPKPCQSCAFCLPV
ncbi:MAG: hypothetical protein K2W95_32460 [Candidatus Obscuribacterales bacterium]|nr:hypothetical protein [Candidatus Obscuribacterales bacterium]